MTKREKIIKEYEKTKVVHPSYQEIANKTGSVKSYVFLVLRDYKKTKIKKAKGK